MATTEVHNWANERSVEAAFHKFLPNGHLSTESVFEIAQKFLDAGFNVMIVNAKKPSTVDYVLCVDTRMFSQR